MVDAMFQDLVKLVGAAVVGAITTAFASTVRNKTATLSFTTRSERVAISAEDPIFGSVRVLWQNREVGSLYAATVEIENSTSRDFENLELRVFTDADTSLLTERTGLPGTTYIAEWSDKYKKDIAVPPGEYPTDRQHEIYYHTREYLLKVFNRGQKLELTYLCATSNGQSPGVFPDLLSRGVRLVYEDAPWLVFGVPVKAARNRGLAVALLAVVFSGILLNSVWTAGIICMLVGLAAQLFGALVYRGERFFRRLIAG